MLKVTTIEQTRAIEAAADESGYSYQAMMENAGRAAADRALAVIADVEEPRITVLVGPGNNGGDGLVAGLLIAQDRQDAEVRFYLLAERNDQYIKVAREAELFIAVATDDGDKRVLKNMIASSDLVMDALFGIGARLPIRDEAQKILRQVNAALNERQRAKPEQLVIAPSRAAQTPPAPQAYVLAIDCPSGLECDTGELDKNAIHADETITFITAKNGQFMFPGAAAVGMLTIADIGISPTLKAYNAVQETVVDSDYVRDVLPKRGANSHKGTYGRALVVAGSVNYVGAPALAAEAAYRSGAGLVTVAAPNIVVQALAGSLREATWLLLPHDMGVIAESAASVLAKELNKMQALLLGPGFGTEKTTGEFIEALLKQPQDAKPKASKRKLGFGFDTDDNVDDEQEAVTLPPLVIDADGLNLLAEINEWWSLLPEHSIITPHPGEMARLIGGTTEDVQSQRWQLAREKAQAWGVVIVLKGAHTVIAAPDGSFAVLPFKTDALATAGTGDVLAGLIAGLLAQGMQAFEAAAAAAYIHGLAGTIAAKNQHSRSVLAGDVLAALGIALQQIG